MSPQLSGLVVGILAVLTVLALAAASHPSATAARQRPGFTARIGEHRRLLIAVALGVVVLGATRIVPVAVGAAVVLWLAPTIAASRQRREVEQRTLEAVHGWLLQLQSVLAAGSGLEQALKEVAALQSTDSPLAGDTSRLAVRIARLGPIPALQAFAAEVDNHLADAAVTVLVQAFARQASGVADALDGVITWAEQDVRQRRDIDARLQSVRTERWLILAIFAAIAAYFTAANRELMAVYTRPIGQLVLAGILAVSALLVWVLERMARPPRAARFFIPREEA